MMKKLALIVFCIISILNHQYSQSNIIELVHDFEFDLASTINEINDEILIGISTRSQNGTDYDMLFLELNESNEIIQQTYIGEKDKLEFVKDVILSSSDELIVSYSSRLTNPYIFKAALMKLDANKEIIWSIELPNDGIRIDARKVIEKANGDFIVLGSSTFSGFNTTFLYTVSPSGELLSTQKFDTFQAFDFQMLENGEFVLAGRKKDNDNYDAYLTKLDSQGEKLWESTIDYGKVEAITKIYADGNSDFIAPVQTQLGINDFQYEKLNLVRYQEDELHSTIELPFEGMAKDLTRSVTGNYLFLAQARNSANDGLNLVTFNEDLEVICTEESPGYRTESSSSGELILSTVDGNYFIGNIYNGATKEDVNLFEFEKECDQPIISSVIDFENCEIEMKISPNPASHIINLTTSSAFKINEITLVNSIGQKVLQINESDLSDNISIGHLESGTYFFKISTECGIKIEKVIIAR